MKKILLCSLTLILVSLTTNAALHAFLKPEYLGQFNNNPEAFRTALKQGATGNLTYWQDPYFAQRLQGHLEYLFPGESMDAVISGMQYGPAPADFATNYEIGRLSEDYRQMLPFKRNARPGEMFGYYKGICFISLDCGNFVRPLGQQTITTPPPLRTEPEDYSSSNTTNTVHETKMTYLPPGGNTTVTITGPTITMPATTQSQPVINNIMPTQQPPQQIVQKSGNGALWGVIGAVGGGVIGYLLGSNRQPRTQFVNVPQPYPIDRYVPQPYPVPQPQLQPQYYPLPRPMYDNTWQVQRPQQTYTPSPYYGAPYVYDPYGHQGGTNPDGSNRPIPNNITGNGYYNNQNGVMYSSNASGWTYGNEQNGLLNTTYGSNGNGAYYGSPNQGTTTATNTVWSSNPSNPVYATQVTGNGNGWSSQ